MKRVFAFVLIVLVSSVALFSSSSDLGDKNVLVAYFSVTGNTEKVSNKIAEITGGTLYKITPKDPYTSEDINYYHDSRADRENADDSIRVEIDGAIDDFDSYDVVFLGYPIWFGKAPKIIYMLLESYDFSGKTIVPFCTSGSSPIGRSATDLHPLQGDAIWKDGKRFSSSVNDKTLRDWIDSLDI